MIKKIGERIRRIRTSKGYSQANVAEDLGITSGAYAKIERGETDASSGRLLQIATILEVNIIDFFEDKSAFAQEKTPYGYASKEEMENLQRQLQSLLKEMAKLRSEVGGGKKISKTKKKR